MKQTENLTSKATIPLVLTSDNNYTPFLYTTMLSALETANKNTFYDFYLLVTDDFLNKNKEEINKLKKKYNCTINFIDIKNKFNNSGWHVASWYRLLLADLLPPNIDKCIFLDDDICVCTDLTDLYNTDMQDNYLSGVLLCSYYMNEEHHCKLLNLPSMKQAVNAGVLLYNLKQMREDNITQKFIKLSDKDWPSYDQDIMNVVCYGKIKILPPKYNVMIKHLFINDVRLNDLYTKEEIEEAKNTPNLIHFLDEQKPWQGFRKYGSYWWKVAIKTPYKFSFMFCFIKNILNPIPKIKSIVKSFVPKGIKTDIKRNIKFLIKKDITNPLENELNSIKKQLVEQNDKINKQQEEIEKLKRQMKG